MKGKVLAASAVLAAMMLSTGASAADAEVTLQIGFENSISEPIGQALEKWQQLVDEKGDGSLKLELYPDSQLGSKNELIDASWCRYESWNDVREESKSPAV